MSNNNNCSISGIVEPAIDEAGTNAVIELLFTVQIINLVTPSIILTLKKILAPSRKLQ